MRRQIAMLLGLLLTAALSLSCEGPTPTPSPEVPTATAEAGAEATAEDDRSALAAMHEDYRAALDVVDALVAGDLPRANASAWELAIPPDESRIPDSWEPWTEGIRIHGADLVVEDDPGRAASHTAALLDRCGACHVAAGAVVRFTDVEMPGEASGAGPRMVLHAWAADRLAEGLIGPSDPRWIAGAEALAVAPLIPESVAGAADPWLVDAGRLAEQVGDIGRLARDTFTPAERRAAYASYLQTCVGCHTLFRDRVSLER